MSLVQACDSLESLQRLVEAGIWKNQATLINEIFHRFSELVSHNRNTNFGTEEFWDAVLGNSDVPDGYDDCEDICSSVPITPAQLQQVIESGIWRQWPLLRNQLFDRYLQFRQRGHQLSNFGNDEFWNEFLGGFNDEEDHDEPPIEVFEETNDNNGKNIEFEAFQGEGGHGNTAEEENQITPSDYYELQPMFKKSTKRFGTNYGQYNLIFKNMDKIKDIEVALLAIFMEVLETLKADGHKDDLVSFIMMHPALDIPILLELMPQNRLTAEAIADYICRVLQSKKNLNFDEKMIVYFTHICRPAGRGWLQRKYTTNTEDFLKKKRAIIQIVNDDDLCCARAIVVSQARIDEDPQYNIIRQGDRGNKTIQRTLAKELMERAGLGNHQGPCGPEEWMALQQALGYGKYQLKIFDKDIFNGLIYAGPEAPKIVHIWHHDMHFDVITSMTAFFENSYYCEDCNKCYKHRIDHQICPNRCASCFEPGRCVSNCAMKKCDGCHRFFYNDQCFQNHLRSGVTKSKQKIMPICEQLHRCESCHKEYYTRKGHKCGARECKICKMDNIGSDHQCFIQPYHKKSSADNEEAEDPLAERPEIVHTEDDEIDGDATDGGPSKKKRKVQQQTTFIFYDMESRQDESIGQNDQGDIKLHQVNLVVAHKVCEQCCNNEKLGPCYHCKENRKLFEGDGCLDQFCEWLFSKQNKNSIAVAHNSKGYDGQFILEYCHRQGLKPKQIISRGLGIMYMEIGGIKFKDSLNFLPMPLSALPKAFDVQECKKGHFPHLFNTKENWNYDGEWPAAEYYQPQYMKDGDRTKFFEWYEQQCGKRFDFQKELKEYCESDVEVLRKCCLKFRQLFLEIGDLDPFVESITIASICNKYYRMHHLPINRIAVVPHGGYRKEEQQSIIALKWLKWESHKSSQRIQHKLNGGEVKIGNFKVDGIHDKTIYEFYGCFWHGCPACMHKRKQTAADGYLTAAEAYQRTMDRKKTLESLGYTVIEKWECQLNRELKSSIEMAEFFKHVQIVEPLDAREAFFGGRTNATVLYHKVKDGERINYIDILSLYPSICKFGRFPCGHPEVITENFQPITTENMPYEGLIKCRILPPRRLLHPLLPFRANKKLLFPLCATCAKMCQQTPCQHSDEERALVGAWVTLEVKKALELGYRLLDVYEVWHYSECEQYDRDTKTGGLFSEYINDFLRIKQEADGFPEDVDTPEKQQAFIKLWREREGIELRIDKMIKNPGLRALAKLMLNSFWGKFGQRSKLPKTVYFTDPEAYFRLVFDPTISTKNVSIVNEKMVAVSYEQSDEFVDVLANTNTVIAAYTTAQARLKLYSYIEQLQDRVLYFDTDSILFLTRPGDVYYPPTGNLLGEMTDELEKDYGAGSYITEFASGGPKHYGYKVWSTRDQKEKTSIKCKGFRIDHDVAADVNFETLCRKVHSFVKDRNREESEILIRRIEKTAERKVVTVTRKKVYRVTYDKRVIQQDYTTMPYGF